MNIYIFSLIVQNEIHNYIMIENYCDLTLGLILFYKTNKL